MPDDPVQSPTRWVIVAAALTAGAVAGMQYGKALPAIPSLRVELGLGLVIAGWITSTFNAIAATTGVLGGSAVDLYGQRRTLLAGLLCLVAGSLLGSLADGAGGLIAARILEGVGFVLVAVAAPSLISSAAHPRDRSLALGIWGSNIPIGIALAMVLSPLLLGTVGWRGLWLATSAITALCFFFVLAVTRGPAMPPTPSQERGFSVERLRRTMRSAGPWLLAGCFAAYTFQWTGLMAWLPTFLIEEQGRSVVASTLLAALVVAVNVPGNFTGAWLLHRGASRWRLIALANGVMGLLALGIVSSGAPDGVRYAMCLAFSYIAGLLPSSVFASVPVHAPGPAFMGVTNGVIVHGANAGNLVGPPALALLVVSLGGWEVTGWPLLAVGACGVGLAFALRSVEARRS